MIEDDKDEPSTARPAEAGSPDNADTESDTGASVGDDLTSDGTERKAAYKVGYRRPPKATRFKRGQSGNPKGRRSGTKNTATFLREELDRRQWVMVDGKRRLLTNREIIIIQQINRARKGDAKAFRALMEHDVQLVAETQAETERKDLTAEEHRILASHLDYLKHK